MALGPRTLGGFIPAPLQNPILTPTHAVISPVPTSTKGECDWEDGLIFKGYWVTHFQDIIRHA